MSTTKQLLAKLLKRRLAIKNGKGANQAHKVVYLELTPELVAVQNDFQTEANLLAQAMEDAHTAHGDRLHGDGTDLDPSGCTVSFATKADAKKAAQFLADIYGIWHNSLEGTERMDDYRFGDKSIRCKIDHVCSFFDPNGFMNIDFTDHRVRDVITIDRNQRQFAKKYLDAFSHVQEGGIVPDWAYARRDRDRIWKTHRLKLKLTRSIVSSCRLKKPHPEITVPSHAITFQNDEDGVEILMDGVVPEKFNSTSRRAVLALSLQPDLGAVNTKKFCNDFDPDWGKAKTGAKNVPKKFEQAMQSLRRVVHDLQDESLGNGRARVVGIVFENKLLDKNVKQQVSNLRKPQEDY